MKPRQACLLALGAFSLSSAALADKVTRSVDSQGVPTITIKGSATSAPPAPPVAVKGQKDFQVYQLDGEGQPAPAEPAAQVIVVGYPPPIAPNPAAYNYGYGYGYPGYPIYPGDLGPACGPVGYPANYYPSPQPLPQPLNYQNPPLNYQNPPLNYQNPVPTQPLRWR